MFLCKRIFWKNWFVLLSRTNILLENLKLQIPLLALKSVTYFICHQLILRMFQGSKVKWLKAPLFFKWLKAVAFRSFRAESESHHLLTSYKLWAAYLTSLSFCFLTYKAITLTVPTFIIMSWGLVKKKWGMLEQCLVYGKQSNGSCYNQTSMLNAKIQKSYKLMRFLPNMFTHLA